MQTNELLTLAVVSAALQVVIQFFGALKALLDFLAAREKGKGSDRSQRSKPKRTKPK